MTAKSPSSSAKVSSTSPKRSKQANSTSGSLSKPKIAMPVKSISSSPFIRPLRLPRSSSQGHLRSLCFPDQTRTEVQAPSRASKMAPLPLPNPTNPKETILPFPPRCDLVALRLCPLHTTACRAASPARVSQPRFTERLPPCPIRRPCTISAALRFVPAPRSPIWTPIHPPTHLPAFRAPRVPYLPRLLTTALPLLLVDRDATASPHRCPPNSATRLRLLPLIIRSTPWRHLRAASTLLTATQSSQVTIGMPLFAQRRSPSIIIIINSSNSSSTVCLVRSRSLRSPSPTSTRSSLTLVQTS